MVQVVGAVASLQPSISRPHSIVPIRDALLKDRSRGPLLGKPLVCRKRAAGKGRRTRVVYPCCADLSAVQGAVEAGSSLSDTLANTLDTSHLLSELFRNSDLSQYATDPSPGGVATLEDVSQGIVDLAELSTRPELSETQDIQELEADLIRAAEVANSLTPEKLWKTYLGALGVHPVATKMCTAFCLYSFSDSMTQILISKRRVQDIEVARVFRFATFGLVDGIIGHIWFLTLDSVVGSSAFVNIIGTTGVLPIATKVACDQLIYCPIWYMFFFSTLGLLEGKPLPTIGRRLRDDVPKMVVTNWAVWIPVMTVSFTYIPRDLRVLWSLTFMLFWTAFLSIFTNGGGDPHGAGGESDESQFDLQTKLRGISLDMAALSAQERSAQWLVNYTSLSIGRKRQEQTNKPEAHKMEGNKMEPDEEREVVTQVSIHSDADNKEAATRVNFLCTDRESLFVAVSHAITSEGLSLRSWKVETLEGGTARQSLEVMDMHGQPITDPERLEHLQETLELVLGGPKEPKEPSFDDEEEFDEVGELSKVREEFRHELVEHREELRVLKTKVREMPDSEIEKMLKESNGKKKGLKKWFTKSAQYKVAVEQAEDPETIVVKIEMDNRPGAIPRVAEEIFSNQWDVYSASLDSSDGILMKNEFELRRRVIASLDEEPIGMSTVDEAALTQLSMDILDVLEDDDDVIGKEVAEQKKMDEMTMTLTTRSADEAALKDADDYNMSVNEILGVDTEEEALQKQERANEPIGGGTSSRRDGKFSSNRQS
mmetsp:Transcript_41247/g.69025  ORF Transcript_41247/g.69025 Transcript_41247/m.69025 type:complete len:769 (-) Transcript_41247:382-2688(-)|eukprot:CAMPEP_0198198364 /NCGR_PEP_ID=MMETSP1445-20131203/1844_1 /TAXON_ID=36898 /ORGANISM="Pyramimonas sp., Strain CCMP2087" /LENGTH=768 /DNA_ID=CAMNT_0043867909 /DNA_START=204 /DNA_END=2510 /DNA_ORIENTATION=+